jgi:hypothetical protein
MTELEWWDQRSGLIARLESQEGAVNQMEFNHPPALGRVS